MEKILDTENLVWEIRIPIFFISNFENKSGSVKNMDLATRAAYWPLWCISVAEGA